jgi:hypothetical protein
MKTENPTGPKFALGKKLFPELTRITKSGSQQSVLVAAWNGRIRVRALDGNTSATSQAASFAEETSWPVAIAKVDSFSNSQIFLQRTGLVRTRKADPLSDNAFDAWVEDLAEELGGIAAAESGAILEAVTPLLDFDYYRTGSVGLDAFEQALARELGLVPPTMVRAQQVAMTDQSARIIGSVGRAMSRLPEIRGTLGATLSLPGKEIGSLMSRHHGFFVRDQYGRVSESLSRQAREIISRGMAQGLGRADIARELGTAVRGGLQMKGYWQTVSANAVAQSRAYSQGASMRAAGIEAFRIIAILDAVTTDWCMYLHDKIVPVGPAMAMMNRAMTATTPQAMMDSHPLARTQGNQVFHEFSDGTSQALMTITEPASEGVPGVYVPAFPASQLADNAVGLPPYHHN